MLKEKFTEEYKATDYETERNKPMPSFNHGSIQANLIILLAAFRSKYRPVSELSLELSDWPSVPDVSLYPWKELDTMHDQIKVSEPPLCVMEILSPTQSLADLLAKAHSYFGHGVQSCWLVLPGLDNVYVFSSPDEYEIFKMGEKLQDKKLGIEFDVNGIFE
ncbi:MAG: Uma2 family endonuclease [Lewinellaceae bacterium]|nr:Uma2 family endonuclease [Saprospiraceae bacterium]MCB9337573.1 Uma2 family endonuclease [Lewinellaceae bacterium]